MGKYKDLTESFYEDYEQPVIEDYIVGFSGLDPDRKIKPETIDHEKLDGLLGGDFSGRYHLTNDQVSKFTGYQKQIDKNKQDSETALTKLRTDTNNAVTTLRTDTNNAIQQIRIDTDSAVTTLRNESNQAISELRQESETADREILSQTQTSVRDLREYGEEAIRVLRTKTEQEIQKMNMDLNTATSSMTQQVSQISGRQESVEATQANISARFDEALEGVTEDSEVIDARVDAENTRHVNLGANVRSLHRRVISADKISHERDAALYSHFQEQSGTLAGEVLRIELDRREDIQRNRNDIELSVSLHDYLQEQSDDIAGAVIENTKAASRLSEKLRDETEYRRNDTRYLTGEIAEEARERLLSDQALNDDMYVEYETRRKADDELRTDISASRKETQAVYEQLRQESDNLSGEILREKFGIEAHERQEREQRASYDEYLHEQAVELAEGAVKNTAGIYEESQRRGKRDNELTEEISATRERLAEAKASNDEQAVELASAIISQEIKKRESDNETRKRFLHDEEQSALLAGYVSEQDEHLSDALIRNAGFTAHEGEQRRIYSARQADIQSRTEEDISHTADGMLSLSRTVKSGQESLKERISRWERRSGELSEKIQAGISELSNGLLNTGIQLSEHRMMSRHEKFQNAGSIERMQESAAENAVGILSLAMIIKRNAQRLGILDELRQTEISQSRINIYDWISGLQEQINELAYLKLCDLKNSREVSARLSVIESEIDAVMSEIDPDGTATDDEADEAIEDAFSTETAAEVEPEFEEIADEIFGVNP